MKTYKISWFDHHGEPAPEEHPLERFVEDLGFNKRDRIAIKDLIVGDTYITDGPFDRVEVLRLT